MNQTETTVTSIEQTNKLAEQFVKSLNMGDVVILKGELGTGKTHFVKACLSVLNYNEAVTSPTFTVANFYQTPTAMIIHTDLYRLKSYQEFLSLGLDDYTAQAITFVEWGDKFIDSFEDYILVSIEFLAKNKRKINIQFNR